MKPTDKTSRLSGFYRLPLAERRAALESWLPSESVRSLTGQVPLDSRTADRMVENLVGTFALPLGLALNFQVNGREVLVPMAVEEPSVIAGASYMALLARAGGGFQASASAPEMIGQIQLLDVPPEEIEAAARMIKEREAELLAQLDGLHRTIRSLGGGPRGLETRKIEESPIGPFLVVHLVYDVRDAMGANAVNTACETLAPHIEELTGGRAHLRILSNLSDRRTARAGCRIPLEALAFEKDGQRYPGEAVRDGVVEAWAFAASDPYRAATHNKGIMNGIDPLLIATGNDWRAVEAGAHAYAARDGRYTSFSTWRAEPDGSLAGELEMPLAVGIIGGATRAHPGAQAALKLMGVERASDLAEIAVSVGLAQNLAALRALATEGIQRGHMRLHERKKNT